MTLSEELRKLAEEVEGSEIDEKSARLTFRMDEDESKETDLPIDSVNDYFEGTVQADISLNR